jgi:hypothetical protein
MAFVVKDRVKQSTTTTGTGSIVLNGTVSGFQTFTNALSDGDTTYYAIFEVSTNEWEVGVGTWTESTTTLARTTVLASSNSNSAIDLSAQAEVFITQPAGKAAFFDPSGDLTLVQDPTSNLQAATKQYVDTIAAAGLHYHDPVRVEQEGNLSATYSNGTAGVGATLTNNSTQAALTIDGVALSLNDRVLIYEQTNGYENGIYTVTNVGSASTNWVLTRATDADSYAPSDPDSLGQGDAFFVLEGTAGAGELYVMNTEGTITFGTTNITFTQVAATAVYSAGTGLTLTGTEFAADGANITNVDAVTLDGIDSSQFLRSDTVDTKTAGNLNFSDNVKAQFGTGNDLQIYHDGSNSEIINTSSGHFLLGSASRIILAKNPFEYMANFQSDGAATLYYDNAAKFATSSTGIDVTGTVTADGLIFDQNFANPTNTTATVYNQSGVGPTMSGYKNEFRTGTTPVSRLEISNNGDISFYEDTGTNVNFFWDASTMALGIGTGTTTPTNPLTIQQTSVHWPYIALTNSSGVTKSQFGYQVNDDLLDIVANSGGIKFRTAGSERMRITSTGLVGINETAPQSGLHVKGSGSSSWITVENTLAGNYSIVDFLNNSGTRVGYIGTYNNDNALYFYGAQAGPIQFFTNNSEAMRIDSSGRVGIGTSSPNQLLTLGSSTANSTIGLDFETSNTIRGSILYDANAGELALTSGYSGYGGRIVFDANGSERMRIDSSGNVGIGTSSPRENLTVINTNIGDNGSQSFIRHNQYWNGSAIAIENSSLGTTQIGLNRSGSGALTFETGAVNTAASEKARIDASGNLFVNQTSTGDYTTTVGSSFRSSGFSTHTADANAALLLNRLTSDGDILLFRKDNTTVGTIRSSYGDRITVGTGDTGVMFRTSSRTIDPADPSTGLITDNLIGLGRSGVRFKDLYLSGSLSDGTTSRTVADIVGLTSSQFLRSDADDSASGDITFTESIQVQSGGGSANPIRIGNGFGSGGTATIHKYGAPLYLQYGNGQTSTDLYVGGGGTTANLRMQGGYIDNISSAYVQDYIYHQGDTDTYINFGTDTITLATGGSSEITVNTTGVRLGDSGNGYFQPVSGNYGSIQIDGGAHGSHEGYSIGGRAVFMHDNASRMGLYDDVNNEWGFIYDFNSAAQIFYNGSSKLQTTSTGVNVTGALTATTKSFVIDHPTKEGMKLRYGSLEGPEDGVYVRGRLTGETVIELPDYWTGLVHEDSITVQLTAMGGKADLWVESIADNKVTVGCDTEVDCFYFVQATRKDVDAWDVEYVADS